MLYEKLVEEASEKGIPASIRLERIKELQDYIKAQSLLHDDHDSAIIGSRDKPPNYPEDTG